MRKYFLAMLVGASVLVGVSISIMPNNGITAELRDVSKASDVVPKLQSALKQIAPTTSDAVGAHTARALGLEDGSNLVLKQVKELPNNLGRTLRFEQTFNGVPIFNQQVVVEQDRIGNAIAIDGKAVFRIEAPAGVRPTPTLSPAQALERAKEATGRQNAFKPGAPFENEEAALVYYLASDNQLKLSYKATFFTTIIDRNGAPRPTRPLYIIDANTGETLHFRENIQRGRTGTGPGGNEKIGRYLYGTGSLEKFEVDEQGKNCLMDSPNVKTENLNHSDQGPGVPWQFPCHENSVKEINGAYSPLNDAHVFGKIVFDMYKEWYNASPLTMKLHLRVHYLKDHENAYWTGSTMLFGDGKDLFYPLVSLDVVAHEVSHGFTEQNSGLDYNDNQSGGMNEAFSDMAGEAAEFFFTQKFGRPSSRRPRPDYEVGADIVKRPNSALRYMCDPPRDGRSIGHVRDYQPNMDVHFTSGIYNKVFCLLSKRSGWDIKRAFDVFVVANQNFWTPNETFQTAAEKTLRAAQRLSYPEADVIWAFSQVGVVIGSSISLAPK